MAFSNGKVTKVVTTVTSKGTNALKVQFCLIGMLDAILEEVAEGQTLTPAAQNKLANLRSDLNSNFATMQTALGL